MKFNFDFVYDFFLAFISIFGNNAEHTTPRHADEPIRRKLY